MNLLSKNKSKTLIILIILFSIFLRFWKLDQVPVSLFGDELDVGYHAYSILKTGKDYSGNTWPLHFQSLAEYRTPIYLYSAVPSVALFGISPLGVRLPAAIFGVLGVWMMYLFSTKFLALFLNNRSKIQAISLLSAFFLGLSPWHIQYSRAAFEVTQLIFCLLAGLYFFLLGFEKKNKFYISAIFFSLMPWIYSSGKLYVPMLLVVLFLLFRREILALSVKEKMKTIFVYLLFGLPLAYTIFVGGGAQRFNYISVFTDPVMEGDVGFARLTDAKMRDAYGGTVIGKISSRFIHNRYTFWGEKIIDNLYAPFSSEFLFNQGDINLRHSIEGMGQLYKADIILLLVGIGTFFFLVKEKKSKWLLLSLLIIGVIPSSITRDGGTHATRLILILPVFMFLLAYGLVDFSSRISVISKYLFFILYAGMLIVNFYFYQHNYWIHNPWYSERWWHAGFSEMVNEVKKVEDNYDKIVISNANEPPWIFFVAWYQYPPDIWHEGLKEQYLSGFETVQYTGKFNFGQVDVEGLYNLPKVMDDNVLYVAAEREMGINLIMEPTRVPPGLNLVKAIAYPSGEPAFYLFEKERPSTDE